MKIQDIINKFCKDYCPKKQHNIDNGYINNYEVSEDTFLRMIKNELTDFCNKYAPSAKKNIEEFIKYNFSDKRYDYFQVLMLNCADKYFKIESKDRVSYVHYNKVNNYKCYGGNCKLFIYVDFIGDYFVVKNDGTMDRLHTSDNFYSLQENRLEDKAYFTNNELDWQLESFNAYHTEITKEEYEKVVHQYIDWRKKQMEKDSVAMVERISKQTELEDRIPWKNEIVFDIK